jgi:hypothetical protein
MMRRQASVDSPVSDMQAGDGTAGHLRPNEVKRRRQASAWKGLGLGDCRYGDLETRNARRELGALARRRI